MGPDGARTIIALGEEPRLAAAARERVPLEVALVRWATRESLPEAWGRARPWPWVVLGTGEPAPELERHCRETATVVAWAGPSAHALPPGSIAFAGWPALAAWLERLQTIRAAGLRLSPYRGVVIPDGSRRLEPVAEALLASHPHGVLETALVRRSVGRLRRWGVGYHTRRDGELLRLAVGSRHRSANGEGGSR